MASRLKNKRLSVIILAIVIVVVLVIIVGTMREKPLAFNDKEAIVKIKDIEKAGFGRIEDYKRSESIPPGVTAQETSVFTTGKSGDAANLGTQIIRYATKQETENIFEIHVANLNDTTIDPTRIFEEKDVPVGERGKIFKIRGGDGKTFYLLFYKDKSFVILTLNFAKDSDEKGLVGLAKNIEEELNTTPNTTR